MNILILANQDLASNLALNLLLPRLQRHNLGVFLSSRVGRPDALPALKRLRFFEQRLVNELIFPHLTAPEQRPGKYRSFSQFTPLLSQPVQLVNQINAAAGLSLVRAIKPDLILSIRYGGILQEPLISIPEQGVINLHSGLLPDYRGVMATFWAMLRGESEIGTTCHYIENGSIDTGGIIASTRLKVMPEHSYLWHALRLYPEGCDLLVNAVRQIESSQRPQGKTQPGDGAYFSFPEQQDVDAFVQKGLKMVDKQEVRRFLQRHY